MNIKKIIVMGMAVGALSIGYAVSTAQSADAVVQVKGNAEYTGAERSASVQMPSSPMADSYGVVVVQQPVHQQAHVETPVWTERKAEQKVAGSRTWQAELPEAAERIAQAQSNVCEYEDSANCHWDAATQGNGKGDSLTNVEKESTAKAKAPAKAKACQYEDSTNCSWNAQEQGNGMGQSFTDTNGTRTN